MSRAGTIVMGTVVAGILSFALWDTLRDQSAPPAPPPSCEMQHPELTLIGELRNAKQAQLASLTGPGIATPGSYLAGVTLETPLDRAVAERLPTITRPTVETPYQVTFTEEAGIVRAVEVVVGRFDQTYGGTCQPSSDPCSCAFAGDDRQVCEDLERRLDRTWGPSSLGENGESRVWTDRETGARATLWNCVLTFDRAP